MGTYRDYTDTEERLNFGTHFLALIYFLYACPKLIYDAANVPNGINIAGVIIYSIGLIACFASSSLYHFATNREVKTKFRTLDHMAIFLLIGGTYTPLVSKYIEHPLATIFLTILWVLLISGILMKFFFMGRFKTFSILMYVFLGCMVFFIIKPIVSNMPDEVFKLTLGGGVCYLIGVLFYIQKKREYTHTIWHLFIMAASYMHYLAIYKATVQ